MSWNINMREEMNTDQLNQLYVSKLDAINRSTSGDADARHSETDKLLYELLTFMGLEGVAEKAESMSKWTA